MSSWLLILVFRNQLFARSVLAKKYFAHIYICKGDRVERVEVEKNSAFSVFGSKSWQSLEKAVQVDEVVASLEIFF